MTSINPARSYQLSHVPSPSHREVDELSSLTDFIFRRSPSPDSFDRHIEITFQAIPIALTDDSATSVFTTLFTEEEPFQANSEMKKTSYQPLIVPKVPDSLPRARNNQESSLSADDAQSSTRLPTTTFFSPQNSQDCLVRTTRHRVPHVLLAQEHLAVRLALVCNLIIDALAKAKKRLGWKRLTAMLNEKLPEEYRNKDYRKLISTAAAKNDPLALRAQQAFRQKMCVEKFQRKNLRKMP